MSDDHKAALAQGRSEGRAVRDYLAALRANNRKRTSDSIKKRIAGIEDQLPMADPLTEVKLIQERFNLSRELESMDSQVDLQSLEDGFVDVASSYSVRQGISYAAWREVGVPAAVLKRAGVSRSSA